MGVDLSGSNLSGAKLLFANVSKDSCQADLYKAKRPEEKTEVDEENINSEPEVNPIADLSSQTFSHSWNGWQFRSLAEVKIAEALDRAGVLFFPNATARLTTPDGRQTKHPHFLVCYEGKLGILAVDVEAADEAESDRFLQSQGIRIIHHYTVTECTTQSDRIVLEFLQRLSQT